MVTLVPPAFGPVMGSKFRTTGSMYWYSTLDVPLYLLLIMIRTGPLTFLVAEPVLHSNLHINKK